VLAAIAVFFGAFHLARGIRSTGLLVGVMAFTFVFAFLTWAAQDKSFNPDRHVEQFACACHTQSRLAALLGHQ